MKITHIPNIYADHTTLGFRLGSGTLKSEQTRYTISNMFCMFRKPYALRMISLILLLVASIRALLIPRRIAFSICSLWRFIFSYSTLKAGMIIYGPNPNSISLCSISVIFWVVFLLKDTIASYVSPFLNISTVTLNLSWVHQFVLK